MKFNVEEVWENLSSHRVQVVQELRVDRALLFDYLRSKGVFDSEDCELVQAEKTNERKAGKLLDILQTKATKSLVHFLDVLQLLNPSLYENLTGQRATTRENPILKTFTDLDPQRDLDILSNHLKRAVVDLQEMTLRYDQLLKENQNLSKRLSKVTDDLDLNSKRLQAVEKQAVISEERASKALTSASEIEEAANSQIKRCEKAMSDMQAYHLALMMKLLSSEEEAKQLRKQVEESKGRTEELMCKLKELSQNIDKEQRHSLKLSQTLSRQRRNIKTVEGLTDRNRELEFISQKLKMEKEQAISELNDLKRWAEALKARYDIVEKNKQQCQESYNNVVVDCSQFRRQSQELQFQLAISQRQESNVRAQNDELIRSVRRYQEQRDLYCEERLKAINERDEARKERDEMYQQCSDAQKEKDEALRRLLQETREFERRQEKDSTELQVLRERLVRTEEELQSLKMQSEFSSSTKAHQATKPSTAVSANVEAPNVLIRSDDDDDDDDGDDDDDDDDDEVFYNGSEAVQDQKSKASGKLVYSIKNRFYNSSDSLPPLEIPHKDSEILRALSRLSRLPCQALFAILCPQSTESSSGEISPAATAFNFNLLPSSPDSGIHSPSSSSPLPEDLCDRKNPQDMPIKVDCLEKWKNEIVGKAHVPRPRAYALGRTRSHRAFHRVQDTF